MGGKMPSLLLVLIVGLAAISNFNLFLVLPAGTSQFLNILGQGVLLLCEMVVLIIVHGNVHLDWLGNRTGGASRWAAWLVTLSTIVSIIIMICQVTR